MKYIIGLIIGLILTIGAFAQIGVFNSIISTNTIENVQATSFQSGGTLSLLATDPDVTEWGICWNSTGTPTTADSKVSQTGTMRTGSYTLTATGMAVYGNPFYVRSYAINTDGIYYGQEIYFSVVPTLPEWGLIALGASLLIGGGWFMYRRVL